MSDFLLNMQRNIFAGAGDGENPIWADDQDVDDSFLNGEILLKPSQQDPLPTTTNKLPDRDSPTKDPDVDVAVVRIIGSNDILMSALEGNIKMVPVFSKQEAIMRVEEAKAQADRTVKDEAKKQLYEHTHTNTFAAPVVASGGSRRPRVVKTRRGRQYWVPFFILPLLLKTLHGAMAAPPSGDGTALIALHNSTSGPTWKHPGNM